MTRLHSVTADLCAAFSKDGDPIKFCEVSIVLTKPRFEVTTSGSAERVQVLTHVDFLVSSSQLLELSKVFSQLHEDVSAINVTSSLKPEAK